MQNRRPAAKHDRFPARRPVAPGFTVGQLTAQTSWTVSQAVYGAGHQPCRPGRPCGVNYCYTRRGDLMAKRHGRPSLQYRYEHYDPR